LPSGTQIANQAFVEFDFAGDIDQHPAPKAGPWINTLDVVPPSSAVAALPTTIATPNATVSWAGQDDASGSGIASYDVYVSTDGGAYELWQPATTDTQAVFTGQGGHAYAFYSVATDNVGHREADHQTSDASIYIIGEPGIAVTPTEV